MEPLRLVSSDGSHLDATETLYRSLHGPLAAGVNHPLAIDLSSVSFLPAQELLTLVTAARFWHLRTGQRTTLVGMPHHVHRYLERMDIFTTCGAWIDQEHELDLDDRLDRSPVSRKLLEVMPLASNEERNAWDVIDAVRRARLILDSWFDADEASVERLVRVLSEIASNVVHSQDQGFAIIQHYREPGQGDSGGRVTIAVADLGIGIEASLRTRLVQGSHRRGSFAPAGSKAILHALDLGVTSRDTVGGLGLTRVRSIVDEWQGSLLIRSLDAAVHIDAGQVTVQDALPFVPGTQVTIRVRGQGDEPFRF